MHTVTVDIYDPPVVKSILDPIPLMTAATGAWSAHYVEDSGTALTDLTGNGRHMQFGAGAAAPKVLDYSVDEGPYTYFPGLSGSYGKVEDVNLLDSRQASFDNVAFDGTVNPEDRYEVWGTGGGTAAGAHTDASPMLIDLESYDCAGGLVLDASTTDTTASTPDSSRLNLAGDIDIRVKVALDNWTVAPADSAQALVSKFPGGAPYYGYELLLVDTGNHLRFQWTANGGELKSLDSTSALNYSPGTLKWIRVTLDWDDGSGNSVVTFYTSDDGEIWTQLGLQVGAPKAQPYQSSQPLMVGRRPGGSSHRAKGTFYEVQVRNGIDGPLVANPIFEGAHMTGGLASPDTFTDNQGNVWTLNGNATIPTVPASQVGWLPGQAGNYFSIPDVNLLDADTAHLAQPTGQWNSTKSTSVINLEESLFGSSSLKVTADGTGDVWIRTPISPGSYPVTGGQQYTLSGWMKPGSTARDVRAILTWSDNTDTYINDSVGSVVSEVAGSWVRVSITVTAPAAATTVGIRFDVLGPANTEVHYLDRICLRQGSDPTFVPSTRIVGDLDLRARVALKDWTPGGQTTIVGRSASASARAYRLEVTPGGLLALAWSTDGSNNLSANSSVSLNTVVSDRDTISVRATRSSSTGDVKFYTSTDGRAWTQLGTTITSTASGINGSVSATVELGSTFAGTLQLVNGTPLGTEIRDGIDGPVVASLDLTKMFAGNVTTATSPEGHTATLNRSGDATTEIVDRDSWMFVINQEELRIPDRDVLNFGAGETLALAAESFYRDPDNASYRKMIIKGSSSDTSVPVQAGYRLESAPPSGYGFWSDDGVNPGSYSTSATGDSIWASLYSEEFGSTRNLYINGVLADTDSWGGYSRSNTKPLRIGGYPDANAWRGAIPWVAIFRRVLTASERTALAAWDGQVSTEPSWLRPLAVFYINANDPWVKDYYDGTLSTNEVLNLGTAVYGDVGWVPGNDNTVLSRRGDLGAKVGSMALQLGANYTTTNWNGSNGLIRSARTPEGLTAPSLPIGTSTVSGSVSVLLPDASRDAKAALIFLDDDGGEIGRTEGTVTTVPVGAWTQVEVTEASLPNGTARIALYIEVMNLPSWEPVIIDAAVIRQGADTGYVPSLRIREDIDIAVKVSMDDWTPSTTQSLIGKWVDGSYLLRVETSGVLALFAKPIFGGGRFSTASIPSTEDSLWIRATVDVNNGSGNYVITFYTSVDGVNWTQLGAALTGVAGSIDATSDPLTLGAYGSGGSTLPLAGKFYSAVIKDGIGGPVVLDADLTDRTLEDSPFTLDVASGQVLSLEGRASLITSTRLFLDGVDDFLQVAHDDIFNVGADDDLTLVVVVRRRNIPVGNQVFISKKNGFENGANAGWALAARPDGNIQGRIVPTETIALSSYIENDIVVIQATLDRDNNLWSVQDTSVDSSAIGDTSNTIAINIGRTLAANDYAEVEIFGAAVFVGRVLTDAEIEDVALELQGVK